MGLLQEMASLCKTSFVLSSRRVPLMTRMFSSDAPERFGTASGHSGWFWENNGVGMGGKDGGPGTEIKEGLGKGKDYPNPEFSSTINTATSMLKKQWWMEKRELNSQKVDLLSSGRRKCRYNVFFIVFSHSYQ